MDRKYNLLIICQNQFGYHIDAYYLCIYLQKSFDITYLCWDYNLAKVSMNGINVVYVPRGRSKLFRLLMFIVKSTQMIRLNHYDIHFLKYFSLCSLIKFFNYKKSIILDIRTGSVDRSTIIRSLKDTLLKLESFRFKYITIISQSLAKKLNLHNRSNILPLGAVQISTTQKHFQEINLLYVGTFHNRNIDETISGFAQLYNEFHNEIKLSYTIIGYGYKDEELSISKLIHDHSLTDVVHYRGRVPHDQLQPFFDTHNVGVSFVPLTEYFDVQPVTKTFEYLLSGMAVLATRTFENALVIDDNNGVLINDTAGSFHQGLKVLISRRSQYHSQSIMNEADKYHWQKIVANFETTLLDMCHS